MIKRLHHAAYRCRDTEETRKFYEDFLGLPLVEALAIGETKTGRRANALHTFFQMDDGSCLAFFEVPDSTFDFKEQHDFDLHIALEVNMDTLQSMLKKGRDAGIDTRGPANHGFVQSIYFPRIRMAMSSNSRRRAVRVRISTPARHETRSPNGKRPSRSVENAAKEQGRWQGYSKERSRW